MDPITSWCNMVAAYLNWATTRYNGASDADKAIFSAVDAALIKDMYEHAVKLREDLVTLWSHLDKLKGVFSGHDAVPAIPPAPVNPPTK